MNLPEGFERMTPTQRALEAARHELVTLDGLTAIDSKGSREEFVIDAKEVIALVDEALNEFSSNGIQLYLRIPEELHKMLRHEAAEDDTSPTWLAQGEQRARRAREACKAPQGRQS